MRTRSLTALLLLAAAPLASPTWPVAAPAGAVASLLQQMRQRLALMPEVARWKWNAGRPVSDPPREAALLADVSRRAAARGVSPARARGFFAAQIEAACLVQQSAFTRWQATRQRRFATTVPLDRLRARIDQINHQLLDVLPRAEPALRDRHVRRALAADGKALLGGPEVPAAARTAALAPLLGDSP